MKRNIGIFLSGIIALFVLSCGGPKSSNNTSTTENKPVQEESDTANSKNPMSQPAKKTNDLPIWIIIVIAIEGVCIALLWIESIRSKNNFKNKLREEERERNRIADRLGKLAYEISQRLPVEQKVNSAQGNNTPLAQKKDDTPPVRISNSPMPTEQPPHEDTETQYLEHYGNGILKVVSSKDQAYYQVTFSIGQNEGKFEFVGDARKAIKNKSAILVDVCEDKNHNPNATQILTDKWGTCVRQTDGTWKVTVKAVISYK